VAGFIVTYKIDRAEWDMPGRKLSLVYRDAEEYAELRVLEQLWKRGSLTWKVYTDYGDEHKFIAPSEYHCGEEFLLIHCDIYFMQKAYSVREFMRISFNARRKKIKDLRKELEPVFREARSYANETGAELFGSLKRFESMK